MYIFLDNCHPCVNSWLNVKPCHTENYMEQCTLNHYTREREAMYVGTYAVAAEAWLGH